MKKFFLVFIIIFLFTISIIEYEINDVNYNSNKVSFLSVKGVAREVEVKPIIVPVEDNYVNNKYNAIVTETSEENSNSCTLTSYEAFCEGCSGFTANGTDVRNNNFYYDSTYGNIHIVAADSSIPFGTIIKFSGIYGHDDFLAIVLDRGGVIGFDGGATFDLLLDSYNAAIQFGRKNGTYEIIRSGF